jgi:hypothetical protein
MHQPPPILLFLIPGEAHRDETTLVQVQVSPPLLQPPLRCRQQRSGQQGLAIPGISPRPHRVPQQLAPAAERPLRVKPAAELAPRPQQRLMDHLGGLVTVIVAADRHQPFIRQPNDDLPVARRAVRPPQDLANVGPRRSSQVIDEHLPDHGPLRFAQGIHNRVGVSRESAVQAADLFVRVERQPLLPGSHGPPHLIQAELKQRQRTRTIAHRCGEFPDKPIRYLHAALRGRIPHSLG